MALQRQEEAVENNSAKKEITDDNYHVEKRTTTPIKVAKNLTDLVWETIDPIPDIHDLFLEFNKNYFWGKLSGIKVIWSSRMTSCAGSCVYKGSSGLCSIHLSQPLLKFRPRKDLVQTLLHEMIHAYLFVTANDDAHGPEFRKHMHRINKETGAHISVYHNFHDEVEHYQTHWWLCNGPCRQRKPFFGIVKRAMNRPPGPNDWSWAKHQKECGGTYTKIKEPDNYQRKSNKRKSEEASGINPKRFKLQPTADSVIPNTGTAGYLLVVGSKTLDSPPSNFGTQPSITRLLDPETSQLPRLLLDPGTSKLPRLLSQNIKTSKASGSQNIKTSRLLLDPRTSKLPRH